MLALDDTTAMPQPGVRRPPPGSGRDPSKTLTPSSCRTFWNSVVLAVAQAVDGLGVGGVVRAAVGQLDAAACQERPDAVLALLAVDVLAVVGARVEGHELLAGALGAPSQVVVEHGLPGLGMHAGGVGEHTVEVEQAGTHVFGQTQCSGAHRHLTLGVVRAIPLPTMLARMPPPI